MKKQFSAWREGAKLYVPCLLAGAILAFGFTNRPLVLIGWLMIVAGLCVLAFFRDPPRRIKAGPDEAVSPADGKVVAIEDLESTPHFDGPCKRLSIFLSVFNVHVNRSPLAGTVTGVAYRPGLFKVAMRADTSDINESNTIRMDTAWGPVTVRQISGIVARRIIWQCEEGDHLEAGEKFGMIRFGSRTELYLPPHTAFCVRLKQTVKAGSTIVARLRQES